MLSIMHLGRWSSLDMVTKYTRSLSFDDCLIHYQAVITKTRFGEQNLFPIVLTDLLIVGNSKADPTLLRDFVQANETY